MAIQRITRIRKVGHLGVCILVALDLGIASIAIVNRQTDQRATMGIGTVRGDDRCLAVVRATTDGACALEVDKLPAIHLRGHLYIGDQRVHLPHIAGARCIHHRGAIRLEGRYHLQIITEGGGLLLDLIEAVLTILKGAFLLPPPIRGAGGIHFLSAVGLLSLDLLVEPVGADPHQDLARYRIGLDGAPGIRNIKSHSEISSTHPFAAEIAIHCRLDLGSLLLRGHVVPKILIHLGLVPCLQGVRLEVVAGWQARCREQAHPIVDIKHQLDIERIGLDGDDIGCNPFLDHTDFLTFMIVEFKGPGAIHVVQVIQFAGVHPLEEVVSQVVDVHTIDQDLVVRALGDVQGIPLRILCGRNDEAIVSNLGPRRRIYTADLLNIPVGIANDLDIDIGVDVAQVVPADMVAVAGVFQYARSIVTDELHHLVIDVTIGTLVLGDML